MLEHMYAVTTTPGVTSTTAQTTPPSTTGQATSTPGTTPAPTTTPMLCPSGEEPSDIEDLAGIATITTTDGTDVTEDVLTPEGIGADPADGIVKVILDYVGTVMDTIEVTVEGTSKITITFLGPNGQELPGTQLEVKVYK